jgi:small-conductance mechanosensitive channel
MSRSPVRASLTIFGAAIFVLALVVPAWPASAETSGTVPVTTAPVDTLQPKIVAPPADLVVANRRILTLRATNEFGTPPSERARVIHETLANLLDRGGAREVTSVARPEGVAIHVDGRPLFRVLAGDADPESGQSTVTLAQAAVQNLRKAVAEIHESHDARAMAIAAVKALLLTLALVVAVWLLARVQQAAVRRASGAVTKRATHFSQEWTRYVVGPAGVAELVTVPIKLLGWGLVLLLTYQWALFVLHLFPYTRAWGEQLLANLLHAVGSFGRSAVEAIPGLLFVTLIFFTTRFVVRVLRAFFDGVATGRVRVAWLDDSIARPTGRLLTTLIWLFALVAAYPYLPGSGSEAFKGVGVFVGLMLSIGASGIVNQAVSGLMLMYTRTLRPGEFVQIGDVEGTVTSVGFVATRVETLRNVEITVPNAYIAGNVTRNFSRLAGHGGVRVATSVTIGYDTPWRQVAAMLQIAAARTAGIAREPAPRVLQSALKDFYVEYTLIVSATEPRTKYIVLDELHGHIQDVFNEHGVQIMSPNYEADPDGRKVVPREQWYAAPAAAPAGEPAAATSNAMPS